MDSFIQDIRYGARLLLKSPTVTLVAIVTLALGIGANTAVFSALNGLIFRPLPVANADRLVVLGGHQEGTGDFVQFSYSDFNDLRSQRGAFSDVIAYEINLTGLEANNRVEPAVLSYVSGNLFETLGLKPAQGRLIYGTNTEDPGTAPVVVISYGYWKKRFNSDPNIAGTQVKVNGRSTTIIGVTPENFHGLYSVVDMQLYLPLGMRPDDQKNFRSERRRHDLHVLAVMRPGVGLPQAQSSIALFEKQMEQQYPETHRGIALRVFPEKLARPEPDPSNGIVIVGILFLSLAGLVLLLACTNVANIVLVRATGREREMAMRVALGARRFRLIRQLLTESILLAIVGGVAGIAVGAWASKLLSSVHLEFATIPIYFNFSLDWRVLAFALAAVLLTGILVGLAPAWRIARADLARVLHEGGRGTVLGSSRSRFRSSLVIAEVAGSLALLVVAGLFVRSTNNAKNAYLGFDPSHVLNLTMDTRTIGFDHERHLQFVRDLESQVRTLPGVQSVSFASSVPMGYSNEANAVYIEGHASSAQEAAPIVMYNAVTVPYFETMRVPLVHGRIFTEQDDKNAPLVAIVNQTMANRYWPNQEALGKRFSTKGTAGPFMEIVGVAKDGKYQSPIEDPQALFYVPRRQSDSTFGILQVRTAGRPESLIDEVERRIHALAPGMPVVDAQSMEESLQGVNGFFLFNMGVQLTGVLGMIGLVLAVVGVYGVISYAAAQRTHEIGIRMAMGATRLDILKLVLQRGCMLIGAGLAVGLVLTLVAGRGLSSMMVGISSHDPLTLIVASVLLAIVGLLASFIPARRAMKVEPLRALKYE